MDLFTEEQVKNINDFQNSGMFHPFTCDNDQCREVLVATKNGLECPKCGYKQTFVHGFMTEPIPDEMKKAYGFKSSQNG